MIIFSSRDHQIVQTTANRIIEILPGGKIVDKITTYDDYLESDEMARKRQVTLCQTPTPRTTNYTLRQQSAGTIRSSERNCHGKPGHLFMWMSIRPS